MPKYFLSLFIYCILYFQNQFKGTKLHYNIIGIFNNKRANFISHTFFK